MKAYMHVNELQNLGGIKIDEDYGHMFEVYSTITEALIFQKYLAEELLVVDVRDSIKETCSKVFSPIKIIKRMNKEDIIKELTDLTNYKTRILLIRYGRISEAFATDNNMLVRRALAMRGYLLERLVNDRSWRVRCEVAAHGYGVSRLRFDSDHLVRKAAERYITYFM